MLRWLAAEVPGDLGDWKAAASGFQALLDLCLRECALPAADAGAAAVWKARRGQAAAALANVLAG